MEKCIKEKILHLCFHWAKVRIKSSRSKLYLAKLFKSFFFVFFCLLLHENHIVDVLSLLQTKAIYNLSFRGMTLHLE